MNRKAATCRIGVDVGGTFTDAVAYDTADGSLRWAKAPSTPGEPALGVLDAVSALTGDLGAVERFVHGITIGTNAIIERKGADVWVVTTKGFRDTLEIQRTERRELYNIRTLKPPSFVPRPQVLEADERMRYDASVLRALDPTESERIAETLRSAGAESIAVCFLHSFANDAHERAMREALASAAPGAYVCTSSEVLPELREYERFSTTVLNAYIGPLVSRYLQGLESLLASRGFARTIFLMTSNGGVVSAERARRLPVQTVLSGPAGGVAASVELGRRIDVENLITYDMGGTSTDVCLVEGLRAPLTTEQMIAGYPNRTPQVEIVTIGAGGGSIAWLDGGETLAVGPRSAGADPGPAAYGRGGTDSTVTDANLVLGRLGSETKLASTLALDDTLARASLDRLAAAFGGIETHVLADGVLRIAVARMVSAIKEISIAKGFDPRDFVLLAYGGAGPMHGALVASELDIDHIVVPPSPGNFSAFGCLASDLQITRTRTLLVETRRGEWPTVADALGGLERESGVELEREGVGASDIVFRRELGMRYVGQSWELVVPVAPGVDSLRDAELTFHAAHAKRYGHGADAPAEIVTVRVTAVARTGKPALRDPAHDEADADVRTRPVFFNGAWSDTAVLARSALSAGAVVEGPALVEEMGSVTVVPPGWRLEVGSIGEFHLRCGHGRNAPQPQPSIRGASDKYSNRERESS